MLIFNQHAQFGLTTENASTLSFTISNRRSFVPAILATFCKHRGYMEKKKSINVKAPSSKVPKFIFEHEPKSQDKHMQVAVPSSPKYFCFGTHISPTLSPPLLSRCGLHSNRPLPKYLTWVLLLLLLFISLLPVSLTRI